MKQHEWNWEKQEDQGGGYKAAEAADNGTSYMEEEFKGDVAAELLNTKCSTKFERKVKTVMKDVPIRFKSPRNWQTWMRASITGDVHIIPFSLILLTTMSNIFATPAPWLPKKSNLPRKISLFMILMKKKTRLQHTAK